MPYTVSVFVDDANATVGD